MPEMAEAGKTEAGKGRRQEWVKSEMAEAGKAEAGKGRRQEWVKSEMAEAGKTEWVLQNYS